jgi:hypothetical protein
LTSGEAGSSLVRGDELFHTFGEHQVKKYLEIAVVALVVMAVVARVPQLKSVVMP